MATIPVPLFQSRPRYLTARQPFSPWHRIHRISSSIIIIFKARTFGKILPPSTRLRQRLSFILQSPFITALTFQLSQWTRRTRRPLKGASNVPLRHCHIAETAGQLGPGSRTKHMCGTLSHCKNHIMLPNMLPTCYWEPKVRFLRGSDQVARLFSQCGSAFRSAIHSCERIKQNTQAMSVI